MYQYMEIPVIKNFDQLATTPLRRDALTILEAGYQAVETGRVIRDEVEIKGDDICIKGRNICLSDHERVFFIGIGKCAVDASLVFEELLGERIEDGIVLDVKNGIFRRLRSLVGTHPFPTEENVTQTKEIVKMLQGVTERDLVVMVISGGGSSLLCMPHDVNCETLRSITEALWKRGATIGEVNTVRKHLSDILGGQLARFAYPATVVSFIFSDVPGDDLSIIASGPTVRDTTTIDDAEYILAKYDVLTQCKLLNCELVETPKEQKYFDRVLNILLVTNKRALLAMEEKAKALGYHAEVKEGALSGIAATLGKAFANAPMPPKSCWLYGGETTVEIHGTGEGGRNQEFALAAVPDIPDDRVIVAAASDGWDNTEVAGAICDAGDRKRALEKTLNPEQFLTHNDSYHFWQTAGGAIITGQTGINVADFYLIINK
jgi:glycerate-2-kinase